jgi:hypothetical protein
MVKVKDDLTGKIFGRLKVVRQTDDQVLPCGQRIAMWLCECSCDNKQIITSGRRLRDGHVKSCGCLAQELSKEREKKYNKYDLSGDYGIGWTSNTNREFYFDLEDYDKIKDYCWCEHILLDGSYSALESHDLATNKIVRMHYLIVGKSYDHANLNPFDNRKENIREATRNQNAQNHSLRKDNTSGFSGVSYDKRVQKWAAQIDANKQRIFLGYFNTKQDALISRLQAELKYFGVDFAPQRHLFEEYGIISNGDTTK